MKLFRKFFNKNYLSFIIIFVLGAFLRFYKLNWGEGFFFHPDEYHIVASVNQLNFPSQMNPHFFSYGTFSIYLIYFTKIIFNLKSSAFLIGRFYSAFFSTLTILVVFLISKKIFDKTFYACFSALLVVFSPGLIQQAHFATPESILTFWFLITLLFWFKWNEESKFKFLFFSAFTLGLGIGTKVVALTFLPILMSLPITKLSLKKDILRFKLGKIIKRLTTTIILLAITFLTFLFIYPYSILDFADFKHSLNYETDVGLGKQIVFYTRQFINTRPFIFQFEKILPYTLGPLAIIFGIIGFIFIIYKLFKNFKKLNKPNNFNLLLLLLSFLAYLLPNVILFAKWTRFLAPIFPFFSIFSVYFIYYLETYLRKINKSKFVIQTLILTLTLTILIWSYMVFSIYLKPDVRITATKWINNNLPTGSFILTESGNMLEVPLFGSNRKLSFDFYHLDENYLLKKQLSEFLAESDYFIVQSRRIFYNHQRLPIQFPVTSRFYDLLFSEQLGFNKIKEFDSFPTLRIANYKLIINDEQGEETWSVFDHPVIRVYKKTKFLSVKDYAKLLKI